jgi:hypothetical protein
MTSHRPQRVISDMRNVRYGEVLAIYARDNVLEAEVYGTQMLNDCPAELWETLDAPTIAAELGALGVKLNGPRHWCLDGLGTKVAPVEPVLRDFNGLTMRRIAVVPLGAESGASPYTVRNVDRGAQFFWDAGKEVHELVDPDGTAYVMQAFCIGVDSSLRLDNLHELKNKLQLPSGWAFRTRVLEEEMISDTTANLAVVIQDELENTYTLPTIY